MYNEFENIKVPDNLDEVIKKSIKKAKHHKKIKLRKLKFLKVFGGIAAGFVIFTGAINVSPALAKSLNNVPIISSIVNVVQFHYDKNIQNAIKQNKVQNIISSKKDKNITLIINNVITDDNEAFITYTLKGDKDIKNIKNLLMENIVISDKGGNTIFDNRNYKFPIEPNKLKNKDNNYIISSDRDYKCIISSLGDDILNYSKKKETYGIIDLINTSKSKIPNEINLKVLGLTESYNPSYSKRTKEKYNEFVSKFNRKPKTINGEWNFNIKFDKQLKSQRPKEYKNIKFSINNTDFNLEYVRIYPVHTKVRIKLGNNNGNECWGIGRVMGLDRSKLPYLIDENNNKYNISGDSMVSTDSNNCIELSFESSYYNKPKELYLVINQLNYSKGNHFVDLKPTKIKIY